MGDFCESFFKLPANLYKYRKGTYTRADSKPPIVLILLLLPEKPVSFFILRNSLWNVVLLSLVISILFARLGLNVVYWRVTTGKCSI